MTQKLDTDVPGSIDIGAFNDAFDALSQHINVPDVSFKHVAEIISDQKKAQLYREYINAMGEFQTQVKPAKKTGFNTNFGHSYSTLEDLIESAGPVLNSVGMHYSFDCFFTGDVQKNTSSSIEVRCKLAHKSGHVECVSAVSQIDEFGNHLQTIGIIISYLKRYTFAMITGMVSEIESDGETKTEKPLISEEKQRVLIDLYQHLSDNNQQRFDEYHQKLFTKSDGIFHLAVPDDKYEHVKNVLKSKAQ